MTLETQFATTICRGFLPKVDAFNKKLKEEIHKISLKDKMGRKWSKENYPGGYTSYGSLSDLQHRAPVFAQFEELLQPHAEAFANAQSWDCKGLTLRMTACWVNVMTTHTYHTLHFHPHSVISGVYYVATPKGSISLKLEDPRMPLYMNAPVRKAGKDNLYYTITARTSSFVLFESWLRHEVPPNRSSQPRVSLSFNYSLENDN